MRLKSAKSQRGKNFIVRLQGIAYASLVIFPHLRLHNWEFHSWRIAYSHPLRWVTSTLEACTIFPAQRGTSAVSFSSD